MANVPASANGTVTLAMNVGHSRRRNRKITITTRLILTRRDSCNVSHGRANRRRSVAQHGDFYGWRDPLFDPGQLRFDPVHRLDDVRACFLENDEQHGAPGARPTSQPGIFDALDNLAEGAELDRNVVALDENQRAKFAGIDQLIVAGQRIGCLFAIQAALGLIHRHLPEKRADVLEAQSGRGQRRRVDLDAHR